MNSLPSLWLDIVLHCNFSFPHSCNATFFVGLLHHGNSNCHFLILNVKFILLYRVQIEASFGKYRLCLYAKCFNATDHKIMKYPLLYKCMNCYVPIAYYMSKKNVCIILKKAV
ncbi:hypothetical protein A4A49_38948 [Nicotiana attenuata]|uniref:Uncharacterized protein n=1 Tax=Nicotiana attenuata TaxID=49451 RepID=A0A1J6J4A6_NICAT|nr:hypothetical protein A4A49_38948 [Nicotiana attenuata]